MFGRIWCRGWLVTDVWISTASILNLCAISVDRYVAVTRPVKYRSIMTPRRARTIVAGVWIVSFLICFPPLIPDWSLQGDGGLTTASSTSSGDLGGEWFGNTTSSTTTTTTNPLLLTGSPDQQASSLSVVTRETGSGDGNRQRRQVRNKRWAKEETEATAVTAATTTKTTTKTTTTSIRLSGQSASISDIMMGNTKRRHPNGSQRRRDVNLERDDGGGSRGSNEDQVKGAASYKFLVTGGDSGQKSDHERIEMRRRPRLQANGWAPTISSELINGTGGGSGTSAITKTSEARNVAANAGESTARRTRIVSGRGRGRGRVSGSGGNEERSFDLSRAGHELRLQRRRRQVEADQRAFNFGDARKTTTGKCSEQDGVRENRV